MIRPLRNEDKHRLLQLQRLNTPQYFHESEEKDYAHYFDHEVKDYFVAEHEGRIIGAGGINYFPYLKEARISWDMIDPASHGKGIGKQLTLHRIAHIKKNSAYEFIIVRTSQHASGFYDKLGFKLTSTEKDYWAKGYDLYVMKLIF